MFRQLKSPTLQQNQHLFLALTKSARYESVGRKSSGSNSCLSKANPTAEAAARATVAERTSRRGKGELERRRREE